jgi:hypothetical protein
MLVGLHKLHFLESIIFTPSLEGLWLHTSQL